MFVIALAYASYLNAELFHMSGILAITFFGIATR
jgi:NhaP-type Na+/H+ or K+/H+ antiporter